MKREPIDQYFREAVREILQGKPRGTQADIARRSGIKPSTFNDLLKGRSAGTEETRRAISNALGENYEMLLARGREILGSKQEADPEEPFKYAAELARFGEHTDERANAIRLLACRELGLEGGVMDFTMTAFGPTDPELERYLNGEIKTDKEYFDLCRNKVEEQLNWLENEIEKAKKMRALFKEDKNKKT
jgi:transcriptional regulator with XRE-family HTH domain